MQSDVSGLVSPRTVVALRGLVLIGSMLLSGHEYFTESVFTLSQETRLPRWFEQPAGVSRGELTVEIRYFADGHVTCILRNERRGTRLAAVKGKELNNRPLKLRRFDPRVPPGTRANDSIVEVDGTVEIVEHRRREPAFDISDDPIVRAELFELLEEQRKMEH